ncbi:MAG: glycosyltransferase family 4 protein [Acidimicrobiales bacterium]
MRVALVTYGTGEAATGGYLYNRRILGELAAWGDQVEVVSLPEGTYPRHLAHSVSPSLPRLVAASPCDVMLQDELCHPSLLVANRAPRAPRPIVALVHVLRSSEHGHTRWRRVYAAAERRYLATVDAVVCNSHATRGAVESLMGRTLPGVVAYPGADHLTAPVSDEDVLRRARAPGPLRIASVANVVPGKGLHDLVTALARLPAGSWHLVVAGSLTTDRRYVERLKGLARGLGVERDIEFPGSLPDDAIASLLVSNHVVAIPSRYEALGIAYLEAMRFGLPVIATAAGGPPEIIEDGREGFLVAPGDIDAITRALRSLADDRDLVVRMGLAARRRAASHVSWEQSGEQVRELLLSLCRRRREVSSA